MGFSMTCDSCGAQILGPDNRVMMQFPSGGGDAGISIDLCLDCGKNAINDVKVKKAVTKFNERREAAATAAGAVPSARTP